MAIRSINKSITGYLEISKDYYTFARLTSTTEKHRAGKSIPMWLDDPAFRAKRVKITVEVIDDE